MLLFVVSSDEENIHIYMYCTRVSSAQADRAQIFFPPPRGAKSTYTKINVKERGPLGEGSRLPG